MEPAEVPGIAQHCVELVTSTTGRFLDGSAASLVQLDVTCQELAPLSGRRLALWWLLVGAYTGEVVQAAHDARWTADEREPDALALTERGVLGFPFSLARRVLTAEPFKSLETFERVWPSVVARSAREDPGHVQP